VLDGRGTVSDPSAFSDANHLSASGAYAYSLALGDALRQSLAGRSPSRWLALSPFQPRPLPEGLEDVNQSTVALEQAGKVRR
jgi:hypothetical protein